MSLRPRKLARPWAKMPRCYWPTRTPSEKFILMPTTKWWTFIQVNKYIFSRIFISKAFNDTLMCNYILFLNGFKIKIFKKIPIIPHIFFLKISMYPPFSIIHSCAAVHYSCLGIKTSFDWIKPSKFARIGIEMTFTLILKIIVSLNCMIYLPFELRNSDFKVNTAAK